MNYDFIEAVLHRPKMDTLTGSYFEVIAFLEGYYSGLVKSTNEMNESAKWSYFKQWLTKELDASTENPFGLLYGKDQTNIFNSLISFYQQFKIDFSEEQILGQQLAA